eukprot:s261_g6.t1
MFALRLWVRICPAIVGADLHVHAFSSAADMQQALEPCTPCDIWSHYAELFRTTVDSHSNLARHLQFINLPAWFGGQECTGSSCISLAMFGDTCRHFFFRVFGATRFRLLCSGVCVALVAGVGNPTVPN